MVSNSKPMGPNAWLRSVAVVAGNGSSSGSATLAGHGIQDVVGYAAVAVAAELGAQVLRIIVHAAVVHAELQAVLAMRHR